MDEPSTILGTACISEPASNPKVEHETRAFLQELNSGEGKRIEELSPQEARDLLANLQAGVPHSLAPAEIEHKTVEQEPLTVSLTIVRPTNVREKVPRFCSSTVAGSYWATFRPMNVSLATWYRNRESAPSSSTILSHPKHGTLLRSMRLMRHKVGRSPW
jgi:hypothetical protein